MEEFTYHNAKLVWSAPKSDGGSPISKYLVEMKSTADVEWHEVSQDELGSYCSVCSNLIVPLNVL